MALAQWYNKLHIIWKSKVWNPAMADSERENNIGEKICMVSPTMALAQSYNKLLIILKSKVWNPAFSESEKEKNMWQEDMYG